MHHQHGVARYGGMVKRAIGGVERDYLLLEYRGDDKLYVPSDQIDAVRHYTGGETPVADPARRRRLAEGQGPGAGRGAARSPRSWSCSTRRGCTAPGHAFPPDTPWQRELEDAFPYEETPDQLKAIDDVKADMEAEHPMDRLVCGDVGFGKTEVAIRAAFKAVQDGKQVAILVPTTLLAQQHYQTFTRPLRRLPGAGRGAVAASSPRPRPSGWPTACATGEVDVVIGTHRLLSDDIEFKDLGLLVVDEEQRFGVSHKEQIKQLRPTSTCSRSRPRPIPRTLEMSLTGIRDLTLLNTPPADRQPILTYVGEYDDRAVAEAIRRELLREGQVFFVHNRVQDIEDVAATAPRARARGPHRRRPRPDGRGHARAGRARLLGGRVRRAGVHHHHRVGHRHADGEHARGRPGRPASASASSTSSAAGSAGPASGPTPTCSSRPTGR